MRATSRIILLLGVLCSAAWSTAAEAPTPPGQPKTGPGGLEAPHASVRTGSLGAGDGQVWFFEPDRPAPRNAPVVLFLHGWGAMDPKAYRAWIDHLARRGSIVIYPRYQASRLTRPTAMTENSAKAIRAALAELKKPGHATPDEERVAAVGHSLGAVIAANLAARAVALDVPQPRVLMCVEPGDSKGSHVARRFGRRIPSILGDYSTIPKDTLVLILVGDSDRFVGDRTARRIWRGIRHLPKEDRDFITVVSDDHGSPALRAGHFFPAAPAHSPLGRFAGVDALDYYGTWRLLDALADVAFHGTNRRTALGNTPEQRFMGTWSDGTPVKALEVLDE
jgi:acetyl esterase/lipase